MADRERLDSAVAAQMNVTRSQARGLILAGRVRVNGRLAAKAGSPVPAGALLEVQASPAYVSRGGDKLAAALAAALTTGCATACPSARSPTVSANP